ncbi:hypothetical protein AXF42_Ash021319 [Apostasia shenzhenica]|uniref:Uncharacterized protein n=1 Tax=Apostasia shenzhenica TaxID=1088818 RepID=A0A2H9ZYZ3_9ASPA|nr:hypothetical protein AXF42_Ash021319 [Apostasia shenzhenica]
MAASYLLPVLLLGTSVAALMTSAQPIVRFLSPFYEVDRNDRTFDLVIAAALQEYNSNAYANSHPFFHKLRALSVLRSMMVVGVPAVVPAVVPYIPRVAYMFILNLGGQMLYPGQQPGGPAVVVRINLAFWVNLPLYAANIISGTFSSGVVD